MTETVRYGAVSFSRPERMRRMADAEAAERFVGTKVVGPAFLDEERQATMRIETTGREISPEGLEERLSEYQAMFARLSPGYTPGEAATRLEPTPMGVLTFSSHELSRDVFNLFTVICADGTEYLAMYSCDINDAPHAFKEWQKELLDIRVSSE